MNSSDSSDGSAVAFQTSIYTTGFYTTSHTAHIFEQSETNQVACFFIFFCIVASIVIISRFLLRLYRCMDMNVYKIAVRVRDIRLTFIPYPILFIFIFSESVSTFVLYFYDKRREINDDAPPIIYSKGADVTLHYLFWLAFWIFAQCKFTKLCRVPLHTGTCTVHQYMYMSMYG